MTTKEIRVEEREGVEYELSPVEHAKKGVGLAPTKIPQGDTEDDKLEWLTNEYGAGAIVACFGRQLKQDSMNAVRGKYNKDKVTASTINRAIGDGTMTTEMIEQANKDFKDGKGKNWTTCAAAIIGFGEDALKNADPEHIHWDCAK